MRISTFIAAASAVAAGLLSVSGASAATISTPDSFSVSSASLQAGAHTDTTVNFHLRSDDRQNEGFLEPFHLLRNLDTDLPAGLIGNPTAYDTCSDAQLNAQVPDFPDGAANASGYCDPATQVGLVHLHLQRFDSAGGPNGDQQLPESDAVLALYNMDRGPGQPGRLTFSYQGYVTGNIQLSVRSDGDYGVRASVTRLSSTVEILGADVTLWGDPAASSHDTVRSGCLSLVYAKPTGDSCAFPAGRKHGPFMVNPTRCDAALTAGFTGRFYDTDDRLTLQSDPQRFIGCDNVPFDPTVKVAPDSRAAGQPSGYSVDVNVPQTDGVNELAAAHLKDASVTLPEGVALSPTVASGLESCTDAQLGLDSTSAETCPDAAKIGTTTITSPLLDSPVDGSIYVGQQLSNDPTSGEMYRLFLTAYGHGVRIKLLGHVRADPRTGQLTATFDNNPQLPFSNLHLHFKDGDRAPLVNPASCGTHTTTSSLVSWSGKTVTPGTSFAIDQGCSAGGFSPGFTAGTVNPFAGGFSPFTMSVFRNDGDQDLSKIKLDLPPGLLGALGSVPVCADAQAAAGTCGADSRLGSTTVGVGSGAKPFSLPGTVSLAGPYKGAPFSLAIAVPAKAGPFDLGLVVVRSPLLVDAKSATVSAPVDELPSIVGGVPLHYRSINVTLDRPGFMFNATNCTASTVNATLTGSNGAVASPSSRYQPQGCDQLKLNPTLKLAYSGKGELKKGGHPTFTADLGQTFGQAGLHRVAVTLPLVSSLQASNAKALCTPAQAATRACPEASIVGRASATTPALHGSLTGPVYFVEGTRKTATGKTVSTLPKLWLKLQGDGVPLDLWADTATKNDRLVTTFADIPDAPISNFKLQIDGGKHGILAATVDPCPANKTAIAQFDGQNGGRTIRNVAISSTECGVRAAASGTATQVKVGFSGIGPGKVTVSGKGVKTSRKTVKRSGTATVVAKLDAATKAKVAAGRSVTLKLTATFAPKGSKKVTKMVKSVTIKGAKVKATR